MVAVAVDLGVHQALRRAGIRDGAYPAGCAVVGPPGSGKTLVLNALRSRVRGPVLTVSGVRRSPDLVFGHLVPGSLADLTGVSPTASALRWALAEQILQRRVAAIFIDDAHLLDDDAAAVVHSLAVHDDVPVFVACSTSNESPIAPALRSLWKDGHLERHELRPLGDEEVREFLEHEVGHPVTDRDVAAFTRWAGGAPGMLVALTAEARAAELWNEVNGIALLTGRPRLPNAIREEMTNALASIPDDIARVVQAFAALVPALGGRLNDQLPLAAMIEFAGMDTLLHAEQLGVIQVDDDDVVRLAVPFLADVAAELTPALHRVQVARDLAAAVEESSTDRDFAFTIVGLLGLSDPGVVAIESRRSAARSAMRLGDPAAVRDIVAGGGARGDDPDDPELAMLLTWAMIDLHDLPGTARMFARWGDSPWPAWRGLIEFMAAFRRRREVGSAVFLSEFDQSVGGLEGAVERWMARDRLSGVWLGFLLAETAMLLGRYQSARAVLDRVRPSAGDNGLLEFDLMLVDVRLETVVNGGAVACAKVEEARRAGAWRSDHACAAADFTCALAHVSVGRFATALRELHDSAPFVAGPLLDDMPGCLVARIGSMTGDVAVSDELTIPQLSVDPYEVLIGSEKVLDQAWALAASGAAADALERLANFGEALIDVAPTLAVDQLELAARFTTPGSEPMAERLVVAATRISESVDQARRVELLVDYCEALREVDGAALGSVGERYRELGLLPIAADAFAQAAGVFAAEGAVAQARASGSAAQHLRAVIGSLNSPAQRTAVTPALTRREQQIVELVAASLSNQQIAHRLSLSTRTVEGHILRASAKFGVQDRRSLARVWREESG